MAHAYDLSFGRLCAGAANAMLAPLGRPAPEGTRLLDAGTGTGAIAFAAGELGFTVDAVDAEPTMVEYAETYRRHPRVSYAAERLPELTFGSDTFDAVTANFVVNHTSDPLASLEDLRRVMKPSAPLSVTIWPSDPGPLNNLWNSVIDAAGARRPEGARLAPEKDFERTTRGVHSLMGRAGFVEATVSTVSWTFRIEPAALWMAAEAGIATIGATYLAQSDVVREKMRSAFAAITSAGRESGLLALRSTAILGVAAAPMSSSPR